MDLNNKGINNNNNNNNDETTASQKSGENGIQKYGETGGLFSTPRPVPSWFHPPMALPPAPKEEPVGNWPSLPPSETSSKDGDLDTIKDGLGDDVEGVTPPLMSPSNGSVEGMGGLPIDGLPGVVDPRQLIHLLTQKVC